jgi:hypothetical protein
MNKANKRVFNTMRFKKFTCFPGIRTNIASDPLESRKITYESVTFSFLAEAHF